VHRIVYIPTINDHVFMVTSISWEWGIVFGQIVLYMVIVELYKLARRKHLHAKEKAKREAKPAQVGLPFTMANTVDPNDYARRLGLEA
jgi:Na+-exporting ATPase